MTTLIRLHSLRTQIGLGFILLATLTTLAIGLPALWLNQTQLQRQAWAQIDQGGRATRALYTAKEKEIDNLALLISQRPTLGELLAQNNQEALINYLYALQNATELDIIAVCDQPFIASLHTGHPSVDSFCDTSLNPQYSIIELDGVIQIWLLSTHPLETTGTSGRIVAGIVLDNDFTREMQSQTGLEQTLFQGDTPLATSLDGGIQSLVGLTPETINSKDINTNSLYYELGSQAFYATRLPLDEGRLLIEVSLEINEILANQQKLTFLLIGGIIMVVFLGFLSGIIVAGRISRPLETLSHAASRLSLENLDTPVRVQTTIEDISTVANALEQARADLRQTLIDLQSERDWVNQLLESIVEGVLTIDENQNILYFSSGAERITGWQRSQVLGQALDDIFKQANGKSSFSEYLPPPGEKRVIQTKLSGGRDALLAVTEATFMPSQANDSQVALVFRDVSEEQAINLLLGQFLSNVAHEFRTPLSALAAAMELLEDQFPNFNQVEVEQLLESLRLGILGLETLIDNLLESASIEARRFRVSPRPTDIQDILAEAAQTMAPLMEKHGQHLTLNLPVKIPIVLADPRRTHQVVINLLSNAIKYGPPNSEIRIDLDILPNYLRVAVSDCGPGISPEYQQEIFVRFVIPRVVEEKAKPGAGLGLSVVKAIITAQGGEVGVKDAPGGGAMFWFTMPTLEN